MSKGVFQFGICFLLFLQTIVPAQTQPALSHPEYEAIQVKLLQGWNTWYNNSMLTQVHMPSGFALSLRWKQHAKNQEKLLKEALMVHPEKDLPEILPREHAWDGSYTRLEMRWQQVNAEIETATDGNNLVIRITQKTKPDFPIKVALEAGYVWNKPGSVFRTRQQLKTADAKYTVFAANPLAEDPNMGLSGPYLPVYLDSVVVFSTGRQLGLQEANAIIQRQKSGYQAKCETFGEQSKSFEALQSCMAWNTIFDPLKNRAISTVNRQWNINRGGYGMFCWDNFFGAMLCAVDNREMAIANLLEILNERTPEGFVPNNSQGNGRKSFDRSQPPVGTMAAWQIYSKFKDKWLLETVFEPLLTWNRWWMKNRLYKGLLCWGSSPSANTWNDQAWHNRLAAALESGLDDSPMYNNVDFDTIHHVLPLHDVGLNSLYINDCKLLAKMAAELGKEDERKELLQRASALDKALKTCWSPSKKTFLNRNANTGEFSEVITPTLLYPMLSGTASPAQAGEMVNQILLNPDLLGGEFMIPSLNRNHPEFNKQRYWKGSIWPPLNFLVYLSLKQAGQKDAMKILANKSKSLLLREFETKGYISENYSSITGTGDNPGIQSEHYYFWGGLLGLIGLIDEGYY